MGVLFVDPNSYEGYGFLSYESQPLPTKYLSSKRGGVKFFPKLRCQNGHCCWLSRVAQKVWNSTPKKWHPYN